MAELDPAPRESPDECVERARTIARDVAAPAAAEVDAHARWPEASVRALQAGGLAGLTVPRSAGGLGHGLLALARVCEALAEGCSASALCFGMHCVGSAVLASKATPFQTETYLRPIASGQHWTTLALSEPGSGANFYFPQTTLRREADGSFRVNGTKSFVTNGGRADSYVISTEAVAGPQTEPGEFSCFVLDAGNKGLHWKGDWQGLGMRGNSSRTCELEDVQLPNTALLGAEGDELWYVFSVVAPYFLMAMSGTYLGIAEAALGQAIAHVRSRHYDHNGASLADQPVLQHRLGTLWATVERTRSLVYRAAELGDAEEPRALLALLSAKAEVAECAVNVTNEVMTLMGGIAYRADAPIHRLLRDARAAHVMAPTTDILRTWAGRVLLGRPLLAE